MKKASFNDFLFTIFIISLFAYTIFSLKTVIASDSSVWECYPNNCEIPNQFGPRAKSYEVEKFYKEEQKKEKLLAQEPKKFKALNQKNKTVLQLDKKPKGQFGVWAFPINGN